MEETVEEDIRLQRASADLISELELSLPRFLRKSSAGKNGKRVQGPVRRFVRGSKTNQINNLLNQFQELPQLLDRHLSSFVQSLCSSFLEYLDFHGAQYFRQLKGLASDDVTPLPRAICQILYTLCKVRGQKVIAQLLSNEAKYLESMLQAFRAWSQCSRTSSETQTPWHGRMVWEERYIMLLWLSHLMLNPFDLTTLASDDADHGFFAPPLALNVPPGTPGIAKYLMALAVQYLADPGKESASAKALLVRLVVRTDMLKLGLHQPLVIWALELVEFGNVETSDSIYEAIGALSFLSGFIKSAEDSVIRQIFQPIWESVQHMMEERTAHFDIILTSVVVRKLMVKIHCLLGVTAHRLQLGETLETVQIILQDVLSYLLDSLADKETLVRFAASKALAVVALQLGKEMTSDILDRLKETLEEDLSWPQLKDGKQKRNAQLHAMAEKGRPDYSTISTVEWHGCTLALAQLLFRRAIPVTELREIVPYLCLALNFDQRSPLGASMGTNIRDAACFGFWALSRKYTSREILGDKQSLAGDTSESLLQHMANQLLEAACLDPSGNIRRGASAALQELIGRHPETVTSGIALVQCVDYHAVASRNGAMKEVSVRVAGKDRVYQQIVFSGLLGWRGLESPDATTRRLSAGTIGRLISASHVRRATYAIKVLKENLRSTRLSDVEQRHGLILAFAEILESLHTLAHGTHKLPGNEWSCVSTDGSAAHTLSRPQEYDEMHDWGFILDLRSRLPDKREAILAAERSSFTHEARSALVWALASAAFCKYQWHRFRVPKSSLEPLMTHRNAVLDSLTRHEDLLVKYISQAILGFLLFTPKPEDSRVRDCLIRIVRSNARGFDGLHKKGPLRALGLASTILQSRATALDTSSEPEAISPDVNAICKCLVEQTQAGVDIDVRCTALQSLTHGPLSVCKVIPDEVVAALQLCLDDYTTDHRGDVGSLVRIAAIEAAGLALRKQLVRPPIAREHMVARICALAAEKLDKVRYQAAQCLQSVWGVVGLMNCAKVTAGDIHETTTSAYFTKILALQTPQSVSLTILKGFVSTAGDGSTSLLQSSRAALVTHTEQMPSADASILGNNLVQILRDNKQERVCVWTMEVIAFLLDAHIFHRLVHENFGWRNFFSIISHAHFKSTDIRRLEAAIAVYSGLTSIGRVKMEVLKKLCDMLRNPIAKIRNTAADALFSSLQEERMLAVNWSRPTKELQYERDRILDSIERLA